LSGAPSGSGAAAPTSQVELEGTPPSNAVAALPARPLGPFFVLWTGQALSLFGSQAVQFALVWWLTVQTGSAAVLATATLLALLPQVLCGPFIGALVDRYDRKRVMLAADAAVALASVVLALLFLTNQVSVWHVLALVLVRAIGGAFHAPAMLASTSLMVPEAHLARIQGWNQALQGGLLVVAAPLGAALVGLLPMAGVLAIDVVTAMFAIVPLLFIRVPRPPRAGEAPSGASSTFTDVVEGLRWLRARRGHMALLGMAAAVNLCLVPGFALLPLLVVERHAGALQLATLTSLVGVGTIAGGVALGIWGGFRNRMHTALAALAGLGLATLALGAVQSWGALLAAIACAGLMAPLVNGPIQAVLQATVAPGLQGRVFTLYASLATIAAPIGLALATPVAATLGTQAWFIAGGSACILMAVAGFLVPAVVNLESEAAARCGGVPRMLEDLRS
jgi:DHA3 family macrolide efflux protein-like MFS transporter